MSIILICILFYFIGSIPTAYLLVKLRYNKKLTEEGSGNIGARNTYDVTHSKADGIIVLIFDFLKGMLPVFWFFTYSNFPAEEILYAAPCIVLGHNFPVWLKFKGGRGLATAAGIMIVINFLLVVIWLLGFFAIIKFLKNVNVSTVIALVIMLASLVIFPGFMTQFSSGYITGMENSTGFLMTLITIISVIIFLKHIEPIIELAKNKRIY